MLPKIDRRILHGQYPVLCAPGPCNITYRKKSTGNGDSVRFAVFQYSLCLFAIKANSWDYSLVM